MVRNPTACMHVMVSLLSLDVYMHSCMYLNNLIIEAAKTYYASTISPRCVCSIKLTICGQDRRESRIRSASSPCTMYIKGDELFVLLETGSNVTI